MKSAPKFVDSKGKAIIEPKGKGKDKEERKQEGGQVMSPEQVEKIDPQGLFRDEVSRVLKEHWNIAEPLKVQNIKLEKTSTFFVKAPDGKQTADGEYTVQVRNL